MEENKNYPEQPEEPYLPTGEDGGDKATHTADHQDLPEEVAPEGDTAGEATDGAEGEADTVTPAAAEAAADVPVTPEWRFGDENDLAVKRENRRSTRTFLAIFAGVLALCILLLSITFFLGDGAIRLIRTLHTERTVYVREYTGEGGLLSAEEAADMIKKSTVTVVVRDANGYTGHGSGFLYREQDGATYICTNNHVVAGAIEIEVLLADGSAVAATRVGTNADADVAVIRIEATGLPLVNIGSSADLLTGEDVFAVGTPAKLEYAGTVTFGKVSNAKRLLPIANAAGTSISSKMTLIQTDTALNNGNSGGPLADMYGKVVGMVVLKLAAYNGDDVDGVSFALPIDGVKTIADAIIESGNFTGVNPITEGASVLGLTGHGVRAGYWYTLNADSTVAESETAAEGYYYADANGVYTTAVGGGFAGDKVFVGDIILKVNGLSVRNVTDLIGAVNRHYVGEVVTLTIWRGGAQVTVDVTLAERAIS